MGYTLERQDTTESCGALQSEVFLVAIARLTALTLEVGSQAQPHTLRAANGDPFTAILRG